MFTCPTKKRRRSSYGAGSIKNAVTEALFIDVCLQRIVSFIGAKEWARLRLVSSEWRDACDFIAFQNFWWTVPAKLQTKDFNSLQKFLDKFARSVTRVDLSNHHLTSIKVLGMIFGQCHGISKIKAHCLSGSAGYKLILGEKGLTDVTLVDASNFSPQAVALRNWMSERNGSNIERLRLWNSSLLKPSDIDALVSDSMKELCLSNCTNIGTALFDVLAKRRPPLETLVVKNVLNLVSGKTNWTSTFSFFSDTLRVLNLSYSVPNRFQFPSSVVLNKLEALYIDSTRLDVSSILNSSKNLQTVSMHQCSSLGDEQFEKCIESSKKLDNQDKPLQKLTVLRVSGTKITSMSLDYLRQLPSIRIIMVESCRNCPRSTRLEIGLENAKHDLGKLAPEIQLSSNFCV